MEREACVCDHGFERSDLCADRSFLWCHSGHVLFLVRALCFTLFCFVPPYKRDRSLFFSGWQPIQYIHTYIHIIYIHTYNQYRTYMRECVPSVAPDQRFL